MRYLILILMFLTACPPPPPKPAPIVGTQVTVRNSTKAKTVVYVSFGSDSAIKAADWSSFCTATAALACHFEIDAVAQTLLPNTKGTYLNVTLSFDGQGCGATKAEINVNNPQWYDTLDVSLVDGYSNNVKMTYSPPGTDAGVPVVLGPPVGQDGNAQVFGLFPYGCDICVARQNPPCGIAPGTDGCKAGTQYDPNPPCQFQGAVKGGGGRVEVTLL